MGSLYRSGLFAFGSAKFVVNSFTGILHPSANGSGCLQMFLGMLT